MISLEQVCKNFEFKISGGSEFGWPCYGPNVRYLDFESDHAHGSCLFDVVTQTVFEVSIDRKEEGLRPYRWLNPDTKDLYLKDCKERGISPVAAWGDLDWVDVEVEEDFLDKAHAIFNGKPFDSRVQVPLGLSDAELFQLMKMAHDRDITLNKMVEEILWEVINTNKNNRE